MRLKLNFRLLQPVIVGLITIFGFALWTWPAAALPPRPQSESGGTSAGDQEEGSHGSGYGAAWARANGVYLELHVQPVEPDLWTVVQWQDVTGAWVDVEGWRGKLEGDGKVWWASRENLGHGPFRWAVYTDESKTELRGSQQFYLPETVGETAMVHVVLPETPVGNRLSTSTPRPAPVMFTPAIPPSPTPAATLQSSVAAPAEGSEAATTALQLVSTPPATTSPVGEKDIPGPQKVETIPLTATPASTPAVARVAPEDSSETVEDPAGLVVVTLKQQASVTSALPGQKVTWTLVLSNPTESTAKGVILSDMLSPELIYLASETSQGRVEVVGQPPLIMAYLGDIRPGTEVRVVIYTRVSETSRPGLSLTNFVMYNAHNLQAVTSSQAHIEVQTLPSNPAQVLGKVDLSYISVFQWQLSGAGLVLLILMVVWVKYHRTRPAEPTTTQAGTPPEEENGPDEA